MRLPLEEARAAILAAQKGYQANGQFIERGFVKRVAMIDGLLAHLESAPFDRLGLPSGGAADDQ
jgi:hypothetical protein